MSAAKRTKNKNPHEGSSLSEMPLHPDSLSEFRDSNVDSA